MKIRKRLLVEGSPAVYHVVSRTACQSFLFSDLEKEAFRKALRKQAAFAGIEVLTFCVMSNHFHLLLRVPPIDSLPDTELLAHYSAYYGDSKIPQSTYSVTELKDILKKGGREADVARQRVLARMGHLPSFMRELKQRFSIWYNDKHGTQGTIWSARYKSLLVEDSPESLTKVAAYIDLNPVRAEIVDDPKDYRWCGYAEATAGVKSAQMGIQRLFGALRDYGNSIQSYRLILYGTGYGSKGTVGKDQGRVRAEVLAAIEKRNGRIPLSDLLKARVRYFTDGMVLGSEEFVTQQFMENRDAFSAKRKQAGKPLTGACWDGLHVMRNLRRRVYS